MARIRSVHPGLWTDEAFVSVSPLARLLAIGIWNECDDMGAFEWKPITLKMRILPVDSVDVAVLLEELATVNVIARYEFDGKLYGAVRNFGRYQSPKKPKSIHPMPTEWRKYAATDDESSEPTEDETPSGSPPPTREPASVPKKGELTLVQPRGVPPKSEKSRQMEDGEGEEREKEDRSLRSLPHRAVEKADDFEAWWAFYPRKVGKDAARKAYAAARKRGASARDLAAGIARQRWPDDPQFIPHPATWLNGGRWQDDPGAAAPQAETMLDRVRRDLGLGSQMTLDHEEPPYALTH